MPIDEPLLERLQDKIINDIGAAATAALVVVGDRLGLYRAMVGAGPLTATDLARRTQTAERYVREWLAAQAAAGYVDYDPVTRRFVLTPEQAMILADEDNPAFAAGAFPILASLFKDEGVIAEAFQTGRGIGWHEHSDCLHQGLARFGRTMCAAHLVQEWIPALDGMRERLEKGAKIAEIECGHGGATILMAQAFPRSTFRAFDGHPASVAWARKAARESGVADIVTLEVAEPDAFPGTDYDLVTSINSLHDAVDPLRVAARIRSALADDGAWLIVEPFAHDRLEENVSPINRFYYAISTMVCVPAALREGNRDPLGAQAGESRLRDLVTMAGFRHFRRIAETPFNLVFEARA
ncbi:MAG TPA: class I SAM-dependent methyltransferase [Thermomicrobiales bacterium]